MESKQSPFSSGGQIHITHTPQNVFNSYSNNSGSLDNEVDSGGISNKKNAVPHHNSAKNNEGLYFNQSQNIPSINKSGNVSTTKSGSDNNLGQHQNTSKQSKYFTFDGNTIFNAKNPVSPARSHLATIFVRQKLGKERYEKVIQILTKSEDPLLLLDFSNDSAKKSPEFENTQRQILHLIKNDLNFISIFQYIVNCSICSQSSSKSG